MQNNIDEILFEIDALPNILDYQFVDGSSVWLAIRHDLRFYHMQAYTQNNSAKGKPASAGNLSKLQLIKYILFCFLKNPFRCSDQIKILSIANYEGNPAVPNRMTVMLKGLKMEPKVELLYSTKCIKFGNLNSTFSMDYFYYKAWLKTKFISGKNLELGTEIIQRIEPFISGFVSKSQLAELRQKVLFVNRICENYRKTVRQFLSKKTPKAIVVSEGNNGDWKYSIWFDEARKVGAVSAEIQHGLFGIGMRYHENLKKEFSFTQQKSDFVLTFGNYHNQRTNVAKENISIGHYILQQNKKKIVPKKAGNPKRIVFIAEGNPPTAIDNKLVTIVSKALVAWKEKFELVIRLHPSESPSKKYDSLIQLENARYSQNPENIYQNIEDSDVLIGHISTVLYEAASFHKPIFYLKDEISVNYFPNNYGNYFSSEAELMQLLADEQNWIWKEKEDIQLWNETDVADNFMKFYQEKIANEII